LKERIRGFNCWGRMGRGRAPIGAAWPPRRRREPGAFP